MTKKQLKSIKQLLHIFIFGVGLIIWYIFFRTNFYFLIGAIFGSIILTEIIILFMPKKKKKPTKPKRKNTPTNNKTNRLLADDQILKTPLHKLSWREFERLCYLYYKAKGYKPRETKEGADGGVDLIIYDSQHKTNVAVQIKHYKNPITVKEIRELNSAKRNHDCVLAEFITSSTFTNEALLQADKFRIETHDINWINNNIEKWRENHIKS